MPFRDAFLEAVLAVGLFLAGLWRRNYSEDDPIG